MARGEKHLKKGGGSLLRGALGALEQMPFQQYLFFFLRILGNQGCQRIEAGIQWDLADCIFVIVFFYPSPAPIACGIFFSIRKDDYMVCFFFMLYEKER